VTYADKFTKESSAHFCCKNGHVELLQKILAKNPDAGHVIDDQGNTPLHSLMLVMLISHYIDLEFHEQVQ
jgi:hypothetical protein